MALMEGLETNPAFFRVCVDPIAVEFDDVRMVEFSKVVESRLDQLLSLTQSAALTEPHLSNTKLLVAFSLLIPCEIILHK
jgi:hypothetical protein